MLPVLATRWEGIDRVYLVQHTLVLKDTPGRSQLTEIFGCIWLVQKEHCSIYLAFGALAICSIGKGSLYYYWSSEAILVLSSDWNRSQQIKTKLDVVSKKAPLTSTCAYHRMMGQD